MRLAAAVAVLAGGLIHLQLYFDGYRDFTNANLGRSFLANGIASAAIAVALLVRNDAIVRFAAIGLSIATLIAFALSRTDRGIFTFTESGLEPSPQAALTFVTEILAIVLLAAAFVPKIGAGKALQIKFAAPVAVAALALTGVMSALWSQSPDAPPAAAATPGTVAIAGFAFDPQAITVATGTTITWTNQDRFAHTVTGANAAFESGELAQGQAFSFEFDTVGTFTYICNIHPSMAATVVVTP